MISNSFQGVSLVENGKSVRSVVLQSIARCEYRRVCESIIRHVGLFKKYSHFRFHPQIWQDADALNDYITDCNERSVDLPALYLRVELFRFCFPEDVYNRLLLGLSRGELEIERDIEHLDSKGMICYDRDPDAEWDEDALTEFLVEDDTIVDSDEEESDNANLGTPVSENNVLQSYQMEQEDDDLHSV